jgi:hypothetical protein
VSNGGQRDSTAHKRGGLFKPTKKDAAVRLVEFTEEEKQARQAEFQRWFDEKTLEQYEKEEKEVSCVLLALDSSIFLWHTEYPFMITPHSPLPTLCLSVCVKLFVGALCVLAENRAGGERGEREGPRAASERCLPQVAEVAGEEPVQIKGISSNPLPSSPCPAIGPAIGYRILYDGPTGCCLNCIASLRS